MPAVEPVAKSADGVSAEVPRDSLRAKFQLTIVQDSSTQELDAVLFSVPGKRYRMELTGPLGIGVASLLWQQEGWQMTFPTEKLYMDGVGYMVGLLNSDALPMVHIHQVADIFDGRLLPEGYEEIEPPEDSRSVSMISRNSRVWRLRLESYSSSTGQSSSKFASRRLPATSRSARGPGA